MYAQKWLFGKTECGQLHNTKHGYHPLSPTAASQPFDHVAMNTICLPCQRHNIAKRGYHPLSPIAASQPFDHVAMDLAGPFPTSARGNHYLLVLIDIHSRFVCL